MSSTTLVNFLFVLFLICSISVKCSIENNNYILEFDFPDEDMQMLDNFSEFFSSSEEEEDSESTEFFEEELQENEDYIDDFSYIANIDSKLSSKLEKSVLDSVGLKFKLITAKLAVHNSLRDSPIFFSQDVGF